MKAKNPATSYEMTKRIRELWKVYREIDSEFFKTKEDVEKLISLKNQIEVTRVLRDRIRYEEEQAFCTE